jgi:hypothetical protein
MQGYGAKEVHASGKYLSQEPVFLVPEAIQGFAMHG